LACQGPGGAEVERPADIPTCRALLHSSYHLFTLANPKPRPQIGSAWGAEAVWRRGWGRKFEESPPLPPFLGFSSDGFFGGAGPAWKDDEEERGEPPAPSHGQQVKVEMEPKVIFTKFE